MNVFVRTYFGICCIYLYYFSCCSSLALPYAFYEAGFLCGLVLLIGSLWATIVSIGILIDTCQYYNVSTYEQLVERSLGTQWRTLVEVSIVVFCGGTGRLFRNTRRRVVSWNALIKNIIPALVSSHRDHRCVCFYLVTNACN